MARATAAPSSSRPISTWKRGQGKCNCSICTKKRNWSAQIKPDAFRLLTDPAALEEYVFGSGSAHHVFCKTCGVSSFGHGYVEEIGGAYYSVSIACLDDLTPAEMAGLPVTHMDGAGNNWWNPPAVTAHM